MRLRILDLWNILFYYYNLGAKVCISDINEKLGQETLSELARCYGEDRVAFVGCDVTKQESVENLINQAEILLKSKLYCFINNAGKMLNVMMLPLMPWTGVMGEKEGWRLCMDINLTGVLHGTNLAMEYVSICELMKIFSKNILVQKDECGGWRRWWNHCKYRINSRTILCRATKRC